jgi:hypothetical protein
MKSLNTIILLSAFTFVGVLNAWASVAFYLIYTANDAWLHYLQKQKVTFSDEQLQKLDWLEKEVKSLNQIQNLKNKF